MHNPYGQLYRLTYQSGGKLYGQTFFAADLDRAVRFQDTWERLTKCPVLTLKPVGGSRFVERKGRTVLRESAQDLGN